MREIGFTHCDGDVRVYSRNDDRRAVGALSMSETGVAVAGRGGDGPRLSACHSEPYVAGAPQGRLREEPRVRRSRSARAQRGTSDRGTASGRPREPGTALVHAYDA